METSTIILWVISTWASLTAVSAFNWTASSPANGSLIPSCPGDNVTIPWDFVMGPGDSLLDVEWYFQQQGGHPSLLATFVAGNYFMGPTTTQELSFVPTVGLRVSRVQQDQFGVYTVHVNINKGGTSDTEMRSVTISPPELPSAIGGHLTANVQPRAVYREDTGQWHLQLECGTLLDLGYPPFDVLWTTSREETVSSSSYSNGTFFLILPNPVEGGDYTCSLNSTHHTTACLNLNPSLANGAAVKVDAAQAQFAVLESRLEALQEENKELRQTDGTLQQKVNTLQEENKELRQTDGTLQQQVNTLHEQNANLTSQLHQLSNSSTGASHTTSGSDVVRLADGRWPWEGRLEVNVNGRWGTVCSTGFSIYAVHVVCKMMNINRTTPVLLHIGTNFNAGEGPILLDNVVCRGTEASIFSCPHSAVVSSVCNHSKDVGLSCWP